MAAGLHADGQPDRRLAAVAEQRGRRIGVAAGDGGDVAEAEEAVVDPEVDAAQALLGAELAADAQADPLGAGLNHARGRDGVLRPQRLDDRLLVDAEGGELAGGEFEIDHLVLGADQLDAAGVRHSQHLGARRLDIVAELALGQAVGGEGVDVAEDVAEAVVEGRPDNAVGELAADVADHVADLHPGGGHGGGVGGVLEVDVDRCLAWHGQAAGKVEALELLELLFDAVGHLAEGVLDRRAGPPRLDQHRLDGEGRVFLAAEVQVGERAGEGEGDHEVPDQRAFAQRPFGEVEALASQARAPSVNRTAWPGSRLCTPAVTTRVPGSIP